MSSWFTPDVAGMVMLLGTVPPVLVGYLLREDENKPAVVWFLLAMLAGGFWSLTFGLIAIADGPRMRLVLTHFFIVSVPAASVFWFMFCYEFSYKETIPRYTYLLFVPIGIEFVLAWFNPEQLVYATEAPAESTQILVPARQGSIRPVINVVLGYLLVVLGGGMVLGEFLSADEPARRRQASLILVATALLSVFGLLKVSNVVPRYFDPTPIAWTFSGLLLTVSIKRNKFLRIAPIARERIIENLDEATVIINAQGIVAGVNQAARTQFDLDSPIGASAPELLGAYSDELKELLRMPTDGPTTQSVDRVVELSIGDEQRYFAVTMFSIQYGRGTRGRILILKDVDTIKRQGTELALLKDTFSRVFRHNIRNELNVIDGYTDLVRERSTESVQPFVRSVSDATDRLLAHSEKAYALSRIVDVDKTETVELQDTVESAAAGVPGVNGTDDLRVNVDRATVEAHPDLVLAVRELVTNSVEHNPSESVRIKVYTRHSDTTVTLFVEDDGRGIPESELEALHTRQESDLHHGSGVGLRLVQLVAERSGGELVTSVDENGSCVGLRLPRADERNQSVSRPVAS